MSDTTTPATSNSNHQLKLQGKKAKCTYSYKATMNDELNIKVDDIIVITQCSEDETWLEGTLNGITGWFPSNYVQIINENDDSILPKDQMIISNINTSSVSEKHKSSHDDELIRIKYLNELKQIEEGFLDEMCKFVKIAMIPLQTNGEIFPISITQHLNSCLDDVIRCHQAFYQQLKEIPDDADAKIGSLLINLAPQFKHVYETYAKNNPKFTNSINKKKEQLSKFFESSISKMSSPLLPVTSSMTVAIYMTKFLAAPFKQLEIYVKILKEIQRYTQDSHIDRGDVQRCIEFYSDLTVILRFNYKLRVEEFKFNLILTKTNVQEIRKKRECEMDIMSSKINNIDEDLFKNGEALFLSSGLIINENGEIKDRILLLFPNYLIILSHNINSNEYDFELKITFQNTNTLAQIKKVANLESVNSFYGGHLVNSNFISKYCFELIDILINTKFNTISNSTNPNRLLIVCSCLYDLKMWIDLISNLLSKIQFSLNNKALTNLKSNLSMNTKQQQPQQQQITNGSSTLKPNKCTSPITVPTVPSNNKPIMQRKIFSLRPHPPLIPHFQLPNDLPQTTSLDGSSTLKRFMYKKPKLSEPFGKYHGADDDLKLLNVIDSFCKTKLRQSTNINVQENASSSSTSTAKPNTTKLNESNNESVIGQTSTVNEKSLQKYINRLNEDKIRLESNINSISTELSEYRKSNKELKMIIQSLQKQLENEKQTRRKLEIFIRKQLKVNNNAPSQNDQTNNILMMNVEHESSI